MSISHFGAFRDIFFKENGLYACECFLQVSNSKCVNIHWPFHRNKFKHINNSKLIIISIEKVNTHHASLVIFKNMTIGRKSGRWIDRIIQQTTYRECPVNMTIFENDRSGPTSMSHTNKFILKSIERDRETSFSPSFSLHYFRSFDCVFGDDCVYRIRLYKMIHSPLQYIYMRQCSAHLSNGIIFRKSRK